MRIAIIGNVARLISFAIASLAIFHSAQAQDGLSKIKTIVVIYAENRSFDHLYGLFPGANGIANATAIVTYDENGGFRDHVPPPAGPGWGDRSAPAVASPRS